MFTIDELLKSTGGRLIGTATGAVKAISTDSRSIRPHEAFVAVRGEKFDGHDFIAAAVKGRVKLVVVDERFAAASIKGPPRGASMLVVPDTVRALGDIARFHRGRFDIPVIAVTGSNGKTTTKDMLAWILAGRHRVLSTDGTKNNHIGVPMTLLRVDMSHEYVVLELGTNHSGELDYLAGVARPNIGVITNIGPAHLEFFKDLRGVMKEKWALAARLRGPKIMVVNADDPYLRAKLARPVPGCVTIGFGIRTRSDFSAVGVRDKKGAFEFQVNAAGGFSLGTRGYHNVYNALAAVATARILGMDYSQIESRLASFSFPASRLNVVDMKDIRFIDDAYNANPASLKQALDTLASFASTGRKIIVMGDMLELGADEESYHRAAAKDIAKICDVMIAVGALSKSAAREAKALGFDEKNIFTCSSAAQARDILMNKVGASKGDVVLLKGSRAMKLEQVLKR